MSDKTDITTGLLGRVRRASLNELRDEMVVVIEEVLEQQKRLRADMQAIMAGANLTEALVLGRRLKEPVPDEVKMTAATLPPLAFGFHAPDTKASEAARCWTGPDIHSYIPMLVNREQKKVLRLSLVDDARSETLQGVRADGVVLKEIDRQTRGYMLEISYSLPPRKNAIFTVITIEGAEVFCPKDLKPTSHDDRMLGLQFISVKVGPEKATTAPATAQSPAAKTDQAS